MKVNGKDYSCSKPPTSCTIQLPFTTRFVWKLDPLVMVISPSIRCQSSTNPMKHHPEMDLQFLHHENHWTSSITWMLQGILVSSIELIYLESIHPSIHLGFSGGIFQAIPGETPDDSSQPSQPHRRLPGFHWQRQSRLSGIGRGRRSVPGHVLF